MAPMFSTLSSYFSKIKRHFYRAVEDARQPCKRQFDEVSDDDDAFVKTSYKPVRKKLCPRKDEPFLPMNRNLHFKPVLRCEPQKRSPLRPIPEDEQPQSKGDSSETQITGLRKPSSIQGSTLFPWTPVWLQGQDVASNTSSNASRRIIPPRLKTVPSQKSDGESNKKELQIYRSLSAKGTSDFQPKQCLGITNHRHQMKNAKPLSFSSKRWKSFTMEESFRIEEKKQYQQLLEHCTTNQSPSSSQSVSQMSSSSSESSSPLLTPVYEVRWPKKSSHSIHPERESENVPAASTRSRLPRSLESNVSTCRRKKNCQEDQKSYSNQYKDSGLEIPHSKTATNKNISINTHERVESVIKDGRQLKKNEDSTLFQHNRLYERGENNPVPLIDLADSDSESVVSLESSDSESDGVEIVDEFPEGRKRAELFKCMLEREQRKYIQRKYGSHTHIADTKDDAENESEKRNKISQNFCSKVENRMKLLDIISESKEKRSSHATRVKPPFVLLTTEMLAEVDAALVPVPKSEVLVHKFNIKITRRDIHTLKGLNWLNDEIVNFYMNLIMDRSKGSNQLPSVYAINTFFYPKLKKSSHQSVSRWTRKVDIFAYDILLVPIHLGVHWCMATVDFKRKCISYYDSMLGNNNNCLQLLMNYLEAEHLDKKETPYRTSAWKLENVKNIPEQMNGSDCGVFACQFAEHKSRQAQMDFDQGDMPYFRRRMVYEITNALLLE